MTALKTIAETEFDARVIESERPVLVDFYADWCGPCRAQQPVLEVLAETFAGRVDVVKVDVDQAGGLAQRYAVRSIPTLVLFKGGRPAGTRVGLSPQSELAALMESVV